MLSNILERFSQEVYGDRPDPDKAATLNSRRRLPTAIASKILEEIRHSQGRRDAPRNSWICYISFPFFEIIKKPVGRIASH